MSICFCASGCGCSAYAEGPFHLRGSCTCWCHDKTCGCRVHRDRREALQAEQNPVSPELLEELADLKQLGDFASEFAKAAAYSLGCRLRQQGEERT